MSDLIPSVMSDAEIDRTYRLAKALAASRFFKDSIQAEQAFAKMLLGRDLGLTPTQSMTAIHIVEGKPELSANLQATLVRTYKGPDGERYDYKRRALSHEVCELEFLRQRPGEEWESLGVERFSIEDARQAGLANKGVWQKYPKNMLFARAMSNGVAFFCPEVTGGVRVYGEGEISGDEKPPEIESGPTVNVLSAGNPEDPPPDIPGDATDLRGPDQVPALPPLPPENRTDQNNAENFRRSLAVEMKRQGLSDTVGAFRDYLAGVGIDAKDVGSREKRWEFIKALSESDAGKLEQALLRSGSPTLEDAIDAGDVELGEAA